MAEEKLLTVREVASLLAISEKEVVELAESGALPAYKIGGVYLRFKKEQIALFRKSSHPKAVPKVVVSKGYPLKDRLGDFFYFNDFYILAVLIIIVLLFVIMRGY